MQLCKGVQTERRKQFATVVTITWADVRGLVTSSTVRHLLPKAVDGYVRHQAQIARGSGSKTITC